ncbi:MFS transporter [Methylobacterium sp. J-088]|uniref:MFS transporter n=1 Tax=Methylobacterium sp. J-088 TaxID=2836664 RepID=UPI001FBA795D|nr:MFS transporter [Methylobacterium sp. J-088]MCJ2065841.1 MFS transporter [Methylobacterium sp. J-088]
MLATDTALGAARPALHTRVASILGGSVGNLIEWFDLHIYTAFSLYFAPQFFPGDSPNVQLLNAAGIFALGFLLRPLGSWIFGIYADQHGRRTALSLCVTLMCAGSLMIAICPTYTQAGILAPALLLLARMLQGLSLGGEYGASSVYLTEIADPRRRGFFSSFNYVTLISGQLLATALLVLMRILLSTDQIAAWGWRIPFAIGAACAVIGYALRRNIAETDQFKALQRRGPPERPTLRLLAHPRALVLVAGMTVGGTVAFFTYTVYMHRFLSNSAGLTRDQTTLVSCATLFVFALLQPLLGALSDRIGRKPLLLAFGVLGTLGTVPLMTAMTRVHDAWSALILLMIALVIVSGYTSVNSVVKAELFPTSVRVLGVGLPYTLATSLFGGSAEYVGLWFKHLGHESLFFYYVSACIACTFVTTLFLKEGGTASLDPERVAGSLAGGDDARDQFPIRDDHSQTDQGLTPWQTPNSSCSGMGRSAG